MLNFLKKLFAKEEIKEEKIELNELNIWLDEKAKPFFEELNDNIDQIKNKINNEKNKVSENLKKLENTQLQNPKIPERIKTIMQGNRIAFIKKTSYFFNNIDLEYNNYNELIKKCNNIKNDLDLLAKSTAKSFQVLNEFFAREVENAAINIKKVENYSKEIINIVNNSKLLDIDKIKDNIIEIKNKIKLKENLANNLTNEKNNYENNKNKLLEIENKIDEIRSSEDYKKYENLLVEENNFEAKLSNIENQLFHDFSALDKALRKYSKIAFEDGDLVVSYLNSPVKALMIDNDLKIIKILNELEKNLVGNKLELDTKKSEKTLSKIKDLTNDYFSNLQNNYNKYKNKINELKLSIENNKSNNGLKLKNKELDITKLNIANISNNISKLNNELEKINIEKLKENLQNKINEIISVKITIL